MKTKSVLTLIALVTITTLAGNNLAWADGYGSITGQFVYDGDAPEPQVAFKKGDPAVKDSNVCCAETKYKNDLLVDPQTKGIANVFIYMREANDIHPDLKSSKEQEVVIDQKGCRYEPHALFARTDQKLVVKSDDPILHNTHTYPIRNQPVNFTLGEKDRVGKVIVHSQSEILPMQVKCDIHPWMTAYLLVLDHPYAAITDSQGKFTIEKLPAGELTFRVWHERVGYIDRKFKVTVEAGETVDVGAVKVPPEKFEE